MTRTFENTSFGDVELCNIMIDLDGTNLEEGLEITVENVEKPIEIFGYYDLEEMSVKDVEELLELNY